MLLLKKKITIVIITSVIITFFEIKPLFAISEHCIKQQLNEIVSLKQLAETKLSSRLIGNFGEEVSSLYLSLKYCDLIPINLKYKNLLHENQGLRGIDHALWDQENKSLLIFETKTTKSNKKYLFLENDYQLSDFSIERNLKKTKAQTVKEQIIHNEIIKLLSLAKLKVKRARIGWDLKDFKGYLIEYDSIAYDKAIATNKIEDIKDPKYYIQLAYNKCFVARYYKCDYIR